jgi:O-antigen/teichoic acid export membrane protein
MSNILARGQEIGPILLRMVRRAAIVGTLIFGTFAAASPKLIPAVFGEQWRDVASIIPFCCLSTVMLGSIAVAASSYLPAVGRPGIVAVASACLGVIWLGVTAAFLPSIGVVAIGIGNLAGAVVEAIVLSVATKRASGVAPYRPLMLPLAVALVSGGIGWLVCAEGPDGFFTAVGSAALTLGLAALGLWIVCRQDLADTAGLALGSLRSAVPRLRRPSTQAA